MEYILAFISSFFASSKDLVSKKISFQTDGSVSAFTSFFYALPFYLVILILLAFLEQESFAITPLFLGFVLLRSSTDAIAEWSKMSAFRYGDISYLSVFMTIYPIYLLFLGPLIGDKISALGIIGVLLITLGTLIVGKSVHKKNKEKKILLKGVILALISSFFFALNTVFDRLAVQKSTPVMAGFAMTLVAGLIILPMFIRNYKKNLTAIKQNQKFFWLRGFFETTFMICKLTALQYLSTSYVASILRLSLIMSVIGGKIFFKEQHIEQRFCGASITIIGFVFIIFS